MKMSQLEEGAERILGLGKIMNEKEARKKRKVWVVVAIILVLIGVRMMTFDTEIDAISEVKLPEAAKLAAVLSGSAAKAAAVAVNGETIATFGETTARPTASTTKMVLGLAVMEKKPFEPGGDGETIEITDEMYQKYQWYIANNGSNTAIEPGEMITEREALESVFLASSNDMADSLAIWAFGSIENYRSYAIKMLGRLGASGMTLGEKDASGYDEGTVATASDLARIGYFVKKQPVLSKIVSEKKATVPVAGELSNGNHTLGELGIDGVKTGYIGDVSGYNLVSSYTVGSDIVTVVVMGENERADSFSDTLNIVSKIQNILSPVVIAENGKEVGYLSSWWTGKISLKANDDLSILNYASGDIKINDEKMIVKVGKTEYEVGVTADNYSKKPNIIQRFLHVFGWKKN